MKTIIKPMVSCVGIGMLTYFVCCNFLGGDFSKSTFNKAVGAELLLGFIFGCEPLVQKVATKAAERWKA